VTTRPWILAASRLLILIAASVAAGLAFGGLQLWLLAVLAGVLGWHLYNVYRLERWLSLREGKLPRTAFGVWGQVYAGIYRLRSRHRQRKKRLGRVIKEFRKSSAALPDASVVVNPDHEIVWLNRAATELLGIKKSDRGLRVDHILRDPGFLRYLRSGGEGGPVRLRSPSKPGARLSLRMVPYGGEGQQLLLGRDITDAVKLEKVRRDFVANASHELRSPLTVINGYLDSLAADPELPEAWRQPVCDMSHQAGRMQAIIEDLLTLSRLEAGARKPVRGRVDVGGLLALIRKDVLSLPERPGTIDLHLDSEAGLIGAENELYSAFSNLVSNAVKYTPAPGRVKIGWSVDERGGHVTVSDTGKGIPADAIPRLTERFYRADKGRDRESGGTGLGLAIVKHVLERHGATLEIESEPGQGSRFTCHFPPERLAPGDNVVNLQQA
jgi:two-component system phosphate regulon sensor histidine kinase PhoR